ncbi:MAG: hypothetical protein WCD42_13310 [Rhizomicrobium sp.]
MLPKIILSQKTLQSRLKWGGLGAVICFALLALADGSLKAKTGAGLTDLQLASTGPAVRFILDRWQSQMDAALVGFIVGFDFLSILFYGLALHSGTILARECFAPTAGGLRRLLDALSIAPLVAVLCNLAVNGLDLAILTMGPSEILATLAYQATVVLAAAFLAGLIPTLAVALVLAIRRRS